MGVVARILKRFGYFKKSSLTWASGGVVERKRKIIAEKMPKNIHPAPADTVKRGGRTKGYVCTHWTVAEKALIRTLHAQGVKPTKMHIAMPHRTPKAVAIYANRMLRNEK